MQPHGVRKGSCSSAQWAWLIHSVFLIPSIHTGLTTYNRLATAGKDHMRLDRWFVTNTTPKSIIELTIKSCRQFGVPIYFIQEPYVLSECVDILLNCMDVWPDGGNMRWCCRTFLLWPWGLEVRVFGITANKQWPGWCFTLSFYSIEFTARNTPKLA